MENEHSKGVDEIRNFSYPSHMTQEEKDKHSIARYKYLTLGLQIESYEKAMTTFVITSEGNKPLSLPPLNV